MLCNVTLRMLTHTEKLIDPDSLNITTFPVLDLLGRLEGGFLILGVREGWEEGL